MANTLAIVQPYLFPYIGYFQLLNYVDEFILYDDVQYMKGGWINRNRILEDGKPVFITFPVEKGNLDAHISEKKLVKNTRRRTNRKLLNRITHCYKAAPYFDTVFPLIERIVQNNIDNLCEYIEYSLRVITDYLSISTQIVFSSLLDKNDSELSGQDRVIKICVSRNATVYVNAIGGIELYDKSEFRENGIELYFLKSQISEYPQNSCEFIPNLSIIDVMMFNNVDTIVEMLSDYTLL